jgi:type II secretory pathway pseudopilin PulG
LQAFTLIELVLSISVSTIICGLAGSLLWNASRQQSEVAARSELVDEASVALEVVLRYLREIPQDECPGGPSPCLNGNAQVASATTTEIRFGNNGFRHNGANLEMTIDNATSWHTLAADVSSLQLTYYDRLGQDLAGLSNPCNDPQKMRRIVVTLTMNRASQTATVRTGVFLRNFMDEVASDPSACP